MGLTTLLDRVNRADMRRQGFGVFHATEGRLDLLTDVADLERRCPGLKHADLFASRAASCVK